MRPFIAQRGCISIDAPLARALLKKTAGDEITLALPAGDYTYTVLAVQYAPFNEDG